MEKVIRRFGATVIDYTVWTVIYFIIFLIFIHLSYAKEANLFVDFFECGWLIVLISFQYICDCCFSGKTVGKSMMRISLKSEDEKKFKLFHSPMKMISLLIWPFTAYKALVHKAINGDKKLKIKTVNRDISFSALIIWKRILAQLIDIWIMGFLGTLVIAIVALTFQPEEVNYNLLVIMSIICCLIVYNTLCDVASFGETIGKRIINITLVPQSEFDRGKFLFHGTVKVFFLILFFYTVPYLIIREQTPYDKMFLVSIVENTTETLKPLKK